MMRVIDTGGNAGTEVSQLVTIDTTAPTTASTIDSYIDNAGIITSDTSTDAITDDSTITLNGTVTDIQAGEAVYVYEDGLLIGTATVSGTSWTYNVTLSGTSAHAYTVAVADTEGNTLAGTGSLSIALDVTAPTITISAISDGELIASEYVDLVNTPLTISGTTTGVEDGQSVTVTLNGNSYTTTVTSSAWSLDVPTADAQALNHGNTYTATAVVSDVAGNISNLGSQTITINIATPDIPTITQQITNDTTPIITGHAEKTLDAGASYINLQSSTEDIIEVTVNGTTYSLTIGNTSSPAGLTYDTGTGDWALDLSSATALTDGTYEVAVSVSAGGDTKTDISTDELVINTSPVTITIDTIADDDVINADEAANMVTLSGSTTNVEAGTLVTLTLADGSTTTAVVNSDGSWSTNVAGSTFDQEGSDSVSVTVSNNAGTSDSDTREVTVDTIAPTQPDAPTTYDDDIGSITSTTSSAATTDDTMPSINIGIGLTDAPTLYVDGVEVAATYDSVTSTLTPNAALSEGAHSITYTLTDSADNESSQSDALTITIDTIAPSAASTIDSYTDNVGTITGDLTITNTDDDTITLNGTVGILQTGDMINVYEDGVLLGHATDNGDGTWSYENITIDTTAHTYTVDVTDAAGNTHTGDGSLNIVLDTTPPTTTVSINSISEDTGVSDIDFITNDSDGLTINATLSAELATDERLMYSLDGTNWSDITSSVNGMIVSYIDTTLTSSTTVYMQVVDAADNAGAQDSQLVTIDTTTPAAAINLVETLLANNPDITYNYTTGSFYQYVSTPTNISTASNNAASTLVNAQGGHVVHINSATENSYVNELAGGVTSLVGISDATSEGTWRNIYGTSTTGGVANYFNWRSGEPNDSGGNEDYASQYSDGTWNDYSGSNTYRYVIEWDGSAVLNTLSLTNNDTLKVNANENETIYIVNNSITVTDEASITSASSSLWNSINPTNTNIVLSYETFETSASGWSDNTITNLSGAMSGFLGEFAGSSGNQSVSKTYSFGSEYANQTVTVDFDIYELNTWDTESLRVYINNSVVTSVDYQHEGTYIDGFDGGIDLGNINTSYPQAEESHHFTLEVTLDENGEFKLGFGSTTNSPITDESFGIDNVLITTTSNTNDLSLEGLSAGEYTLYIVDEAGNISSSDSQSLSTLTITGDTAPVAVDDTATVDEDSSDNTIIVLDNDTDIDGDTLSVTAASALHGTVSINGDGTLNYTPDADFSGTDTITYTLSDGNFTDDTGTVIVTVTGSNDAPVASDDTITVTQDTTFNSSVSLITNDTDIDGDTLSVVADTYETLEGGSLVLASDGSYSYTPTEGFTGTDTVDYTLTDGSLTDIGTLTINVSASGDTAPVANDDAVTVAHDTQFISSVSLIANDTDSDGDTLSVVSGTYTTDKGGTLILASDGSYTYTPPAGFTGEDTFEYTLSDGNLTDTGTLSITVSPPTTVTIDSISEDTGISVTDFLTNDNDGLTINATLSAELFEGEILQYSNDGGATWIDITSSAAGTTVSYADDALTSTSTIVMRVIDTKGNVGVEDSQLVTIDTTAPTATINLVETILANNPDITYNYTTGSFYQYVSTPTNISTASNNAASTLVNGQGGYLVHINSATENSYVNTLGSGDRWIGISDATNEGTWRNIYGTSTAGGIANYTNWASGEPNNSGDVEDYVTIRDSALWNDLSDTALPYVIEWDGSAVLNTLSLTNNDTLKVNANENETIYIVNNLVTVTDEASIISASSSLWNSINPTNTNIVLSYETFETSASGWSDNTIAHYTGAMSGFLGQFAGSGGNQSVSKTYSFGSEYANQTVTVDFDIYEMNTWDTESLRVYVNNSVITSVDYQGSSTIDGFDGGINLGDIVTTSTEKEESHHFTLEVTLDANGEFKLGFGSTTNESIANESFGIDNVLITTTSNTNDLSLEGLSAGEYTLYIVDEAGNISSSDSQSLSTLTISDSVGPVALDINGDGVITYEAAFMDINFDDILDATAWVSDEDGILVWDEYGDGVLHDASQFAFGSDSLTDLEGLAAFFDTNSDGIFDSNDTEFGNFGALVDGEIISLADLGITSIDLHSNQEMTHPFEGVTVHGDSTATLVDGTTMLIQDVAFDYEANGGV